MAKTKKLRTPPVIRMEFYGARPAVLKKRKDSVVSNVLDNDEFAAVQELATQIYDEGKEFDNVITQIANGNKTIIYERDILTESLSKKLYQLATTILYLYINDLNW